MNDKENKSDGDKVNSKCEECEKEEFALKIESIADLQWEEHHTNFTNSIFNPNGFK
ncbi:MAG: hypothetical protein ACFE75_06970 [Candidatus Hodarchaeota archaeon]